MQPSIADKPLESRQARSARSAAVAQTIHLQVVTFFFAVSRSQTQPMKTKARTKRNQANEHHQPHY
jgi:hypothetical protein